MLESHKLGAIVKLGSTIAMARCMLKLKLALGFPFHEENKIYSKVPIIQEAQLSQRDRAAACLNFDKNISANSVHLC